MILQSFFYQWLHRPDILKINGSWKYNATSEELEIKLDQMQHSDFIFDMPLEIAVIEEGGNSNKILTKPPCSLRGRPQIETHLRALIRRMTFENPLWGAPRTWAAASATA